jgi:hypothetical protein
MGWTVRGSNPDMGKKFFSSAELPDGLLFSGYRGSFPGVKRPSLRMSGAIPLFPLCDFVEWTRKTFYVYPAMCLEALW